MSINRNRQDEKGNTKLHQLTQEDDYDNLVQVIDAFKAKYSSVTRRAISTSLSTLVNVKNNEQKAGGRRPLHYARSDKVVRLLVENGSELDAQDSYGLTALHIFVLQGQLSLVKTILRCGASINIRCYKNCTFTNSEKYGLYNRNTVQLAAMTGMSCVHVSTCINVYIFVYHILPILTLTLTLIAFYPP